MTSGRQASWPDAADFASPPTSAQRQTWDDADRAARPDRLGRLRARFEAADIDAYFDLRPEHMRYLTGFALGDGEEKVAGDSGRFLVSGDEVVVLADSRYTIQAKHEASEARIVAAYHDLPERWPEIVGSIGARRIGLEPAFISHALWGRLEAAAPDVTLVPVGGWVDSDRAVKEPAELERVAAACAVADRALAALLPEIHAGASEASLALRLEWLIRTGGAEALAFDVACLTGPQAAMPHGAPGDRPVLDGAVLLFDFGAQVAGYRSDMTRTLFAGEPQERDLAIYELVAAAQSAVIDVLQAAVDGGAGRPDGPPLPDGRSLDAIGRTLIAAAGHAEHFGHGTGHGIGLATHEAPNLGQRASTAPLPSPTVFSVEPGIYLDGETGVRIEDLVLLDGAAGRVERLTVFPREVIVVG